MWRVGGVVTQRSAKPRTRVQISYAPPKSGIICFVFGRVAELVYAADLKSVAARLEGSSPSLPTRILTANFWQFFIWQNGIIINTNERMIMIVLWIVLAVIVILAVYVIATYNGLVKLNVRVEEAWSDITVQLKRRLDLIPNLISTVKGYAKHESSVFEKVTEARSNAIDAKGPAETAQADNMLTGALKSLFAVAEAYPDLKATENFQQLQAELVDTEDKIQASRRFYNGSARDLNIKIKTFPDNIFAGMLGFKTREFFDVDESEAEIVQKAPEAKF